jgi:hypothetical protein
MSLELQLLDSKLNLFPISRDAVSDKYMTAFVKKFPRWRRNTKGREAHHVD